MLGKGSKALPRTDEEVSPDTSTTDSNVNTDSKNRMSSVAGHTNYTEGTAWDGSSGTAVPV